MDDSKLELPLKDYYVPDFLLVPGSVSGAADKTPVPDCPVVVFINSKSGGQLGGELLITYRSLLNPNQVLLVHAVRLLDMKCFWSM